MLNLTLNISATNLSELEYSIDEAKKRILAGNTSGFDSNDNAEFQFNITGKEDE